MSMFENEEAAAMNIDAVANVFNKLDREIWLITARDGDRRSGLIATFVSTASLVPTLPRVMVGLAKHHFTHEVIQASGAFCMHLISEDRIDWVWHFGIRSGRNVDKLSGIDAYDSPNGSPILADALSWLDCRVEAQLDTGDRTIFLAQVLGAGVARDEAPLTFKRLMKLAPSEMMREAKLQMEQDADKDREAILAWRREKNFNDFAG
jgi:flavin reductase (DIM6/NTAB) family NADH-FMN oxidoreductase RutF